MAIAFVQNLLNGADNTADATINMTGSKTVTATNDLFVFAVHDWPNVVSGVTDNLGSTYALASRSIYVPGGTPPVRVEVWRAENVGGGTLTAQTVTLSGAVTNKAAFSAEFSGLAGVVIVGDETNFGNNNATPSADDVGGTGLHLFVVGAINLGGGSTFTPPTGYTHFNGNTSGSTANDRTIQAAYLIGTTSGNKTSSWSGANAGVDWVALTSNTGTASAPDATAGVSFDGLTLRVKAA